MDRVTLDETERRAAELVEVERSSPERLPEMVDQLLLEVLHAIGDGTADKPADQAALAAAVLEVKHYPVRWFAHA